MAAALAAKSGDVGSLRSLMEKGEYQLKQGEYSLLHTAASNGHLGVASYLVADPVLLDSGVYILHSVRRIYPETTSFSSFCLQDCVLI